MDADKGRGQLLIVDGCVLSIKALSPELIMHKNRKQLINMMEEKPNFDL